MTRTTINRGPNHVIDRNVANTLSTNSNHGGGGIFFYGLFSNSFLVSDSTISSIKNGLPSVRA